MDHPKDKASRPAPQERICDPDLCQNATQHVPANSAPADAKRVAVSASRPLRMLLADRIDRQFSLIRSA